MMPLQALVGVESHLNLDTQARSKTVKEEMGAEVLLDVVESLWLWEGDGGRVGGVVLS